ncbi:MAG: DUF2793 domain-containing protein [Rhizobiales bacterium]|nr:DUF2793 domain-containing protein [Hyphomicrobiales bacterium]
MSDTTVRHQFPFIMPAQAQKHVTHNEALRQLDFLLNLQIAARAVDAPPPAPDAGESVIVGENPTGAFSGHAGDVAAFIDGAWLFQTPFDGLRAYDLQAGNLIRYDGALWQTISGGMPDETAQLGINTMADSVNRLAVKSDAVLLSHDDVTPTGSGDIRLNLNKAAPTRTASVQFQTGFSTRAEFGLTGDDDWHVRVSSNGSNFRDALITDSQTGQVSVQGLKSIPANYAPLSGVIFTPGGDGQVSIYRQDSTSLQNPRTATIAAISGDLVTLTTPVAETFFNTIMNGVSLARIWNTTLSAASHSAWIATYVSSTQFRVRSASMLTGWLAGHMIQIGDPVSITPGRCVTLDISPMLIALFGGSFRQSGIMVKGFIANSSTASISISPSGVGGSFVNAATAASDSGVTIIPTTELSPISNSNLVRMRENFSGTSGIRLLSAIAVYA